MSYIDKDFYDNVYKGTPIDDSAEFERLAERASDMIDQITQYVLKNIEFERLAQVLQDMVKKATAAQTEYLFQNGESIIHDNGDLNNVSVGNFSYSTGNGGNNRISPAVYDYLKYSGLLYTGVHTHGG